MSEQSEKAARFLQLHRSEQPLLLANAWDEGSAKLLVSLGFPAIATTSSGYAASRGRRDYGVTLQETIAHSAALVQAAGDVAVSADLEHCFADDLDGIRATIELAIGAGLAGGSIEDWDPQAERLYEPEEAAERVAAAAQAAHAGPVHFVLTGRAENYLRGKRDLKDTIARLQAYERAGADVLYAPALDDPGELEELLVSVSAPVNVLALGTTPPVAELAALGVSRISVGGHFAFVAYGAAADAARELTDTGTYGFTALSRKGAADARAAFSQ